MNHTRRIATTVFLLIFAVSIFGIWALSQFNASFAMLDNVYSNGNLAAIANAVSKPFERGIVLEHQSVLPINNTASSSLETIDVVPSSEVFIQHSKTTVKSEISNQILNSFVHISSTTDSNSTSTSNRQESYQSFFVFPTSTTTVYVGCTYNIIWQATSSINSIKLSLVGSKSKTILDSATSGLEGIKTDVPASGLVWTTRTVLPGLYYILVNDVNGATTSVKSHIFKINRAPQGSVGEIQKICEESGGR